MSDADERSVGADPPPVPEGFTVRSELGRGSSAVVWLARYDVTGQEVALKVWRRPLETEAARVRFANECRWHGLLSDHPAVVDWVWASDPDVPHPWTATRPHGCSLTRWLRERPDEPLQTRAQVAVDLLEGVAAMHRRDLVHRDINPNNVLVDAEGRAVLCDLGIAMPAERYTGDGAAGTPGYVAPEVQALEAGPGFVSDVYAAARTIDATLAEHTPGAVAHLLSTALSDDPLRRPGDGVAFLDGFRSAAREAGLDLAPRSPRQPAPDRRRLARWARGRRGVVLAALALTGGAGWYAASGGPSGSAPSVSGEDLVSAVLARNPDVSAAGDPVLRPPKPPARCPGPLRHRYAVTDAQGKAFGEVRLYVTDGGHTCAKLVKSEGTAAYDRRSYLALTLCNARAECDYDWNRFRIDAGPAQVLKTPGCVRWRVSAMDVAERTWLVRDRTGSSACPG